MSPKSKLSGRVQIVIFLRDSRVRTIPRKPPNTQYPIVLATADTNSTQYQYRSIPVCSIAVYLRLCFCSLTYQDSQRRFTVPRRPSSSRPTWNLTLIVNLARRGRRRSTVPGRGGGEWESYAASQTVWHHTVDYVQWFPGLLNMYPIADFGATDYRHWRF